MAIKHNLEGILDPETIEEYFGSGSDLDAGGLAALPFIRVEYGPTIEKITFWSPKDTVSAGNECSLADDYSSAFLRYCGGGTGYAKVFALIVAEIVKNGRQGGLESRFVEDIAHYAVRGMALDHLASWAISAGPLIHPDLSWIKLR